MEILLDPNAAVVVATGSVLLLQVSFTTRELDFLSTMVVPARIVLFLLILQLQTTIDEN
jgi:hypothetical protein